MATENNYQAGHRDGVRDYSAWKNSNHPDSRRRRLFVQPDPVPAGEEDYWRGYGDALDELFASTNNPPGG
jgi:hypothetical protein